MPQTVPRWRESSVAPDCLAPRATLSQGIANGSYVAGPQGIEPDSVEDITGRCQVTQADAQGVKITIPGTATDRGRTACLLAAFTLFTPDVFAPHPAEFERNILRQYADVPLAGTCKDEWGFPGRFGPRLDDLYFSRALAEEYVRRRPGRDLVRDLLLMVNLRAHAGAVPRGPLAARAGRRADQLPPDLPGSSQRPAGPSYDLAAG